MITAFAVVTFLFITALYYKSARLFLLPSRSARLILKSNKLRSPYVYFATTKLTNLLGTTITFLTSLSSRYR